MIMLSRVRKIVLLFMLAALPLQGVAATLSFLYCHGDARGHALHEPDAHDHAAQHDGSHGNPADESNTGSPGYHLCCNLTVSAPPTIVVPQSVPSFHFRASVPDSLHDLFIPDRPQRPPLA